MGKSLWQRLIDRIRPKPDSSEALHQVFADAEDNQVIGAESRIMLEGVLKISRMHVAEIMIPAPKMDMLDIGMNIDEMMEKIIDIGHSRYPVYEEDKENIIGVLMTKDLLKWQRFVVFR